MTINYRKFFRKYWYALIIVICMAGFMTPGLTLFSFMMFIFLSGFATRPYFDKLIVEKFFEKPRDYSEPLTFMESKPRRKKI